MRRDKGFTLIELMIVIAIIAIIAAIAIPGLLSSQRASNERNASASLKTISSAEADFRANDRDGNRVNDFWTANVAGLYTMTNAIAAGAGGAASATDPPIKLIELSIAGAETDGTTTPAAGGENNALSLFTVYSPKAGYWYGILASDLSAAAAEQDYTTDTGGLPAMGDVHNHSKFGFLAYPDSMSAGRSLFILNEGNTIWRRALTATVKPAATTPPGALAYDWPTDADLKTNFGKMD